VGTLIALTFLLTLEDPYRFGKSRDVGCYLGLQPGRRNSGQSQPQMHISKEGDPYLRTLLVQGAQHILGPFGVDCDLRRWGLKLAERGGRNGKKRAIVATARKLAVLLHHLWVSGEVYEPLHNSSGVQWGPRRKTKTFQGRKKQKPKRRVPVTALIAWPNFHS
jgi:transposase